MCVSLGVSHVMAHDYCKSCPSLLTVIIFLMFLGAYAAACLIWATRHP